MLGNRFKDTVRKMFYMSMGVGLTLFLFWMFDNTKPSLTIYQWVLAWWGFALVLVLVVADKRS